MTTGDDELRLAAEQRARVLIDRQLVAAGWVVQDKKALNLFAAQGIAVRESIMTSVQASLNSRS
jgi:type I restriction enzyme R subunit